MKRIRIITELIGLAIILYLIGAFAQADFNIAKWNETTRGLISIIYGMLAITFLYLEKDPPNETN